MDGCVATACERARARRGEIPLGLAVGPLERAEPREFAGRCKGSVKAAQGAERGGIFSTGSALAGEAAQAPAATPARFGRGPTPLARVLRRCAVTHGLDKRRIVRTLRGGSFGADVRQRGLAVWPEVTLRARNQREVDRLLRAFAQAELACLVRPGFRVEVGGATTEQILNAAQDCLTRNEIEAVLVTLKGGGEYVLTREPRSV